MTSNSRNEELELPDGLESRCRRSYDWTPTFAGKAIAAYRQFMKLKLQNEDWDASILSPSLTVDKVWHQHILDVQQYVRACNDYCGAIIGHNPDGGLDVESRLARIKTTKACLKTLFGRDGLDAEIWFGDEEAETEADGGGDRTRRRVTIEDFAQVKLSFEFIHRCVHVNDAPRGTLSLKKHDKLNIALLRFLAQEQINGLNFWYKNMQVQQNDTIRSMLPCDDSVLGFMTEQEIGQGLEVTISVTGDMYGVGSGPNSSHLVPITLRVRDQTGEETFFKIKSTTLMVKVFDTYAQRKGVHVNDLRFLLDGEHIKPWETPCALALDDHDQIDCMLEQSGC